MRIDKESLLKRYAQTAEDRTLLAHALDRFVCAMKREQRTSTHFLDGRESMLIRHMMQATGAEAQLALWGGYEGAERTCAFFYPLGSDVQQVEWLEHAPIVRLRIEKHARDTLSHRDYLGAMMGLGIKRSCFGDILVGEHGADVFVLQEQASFFLQHLQKIGNKSVAVRVATPEDALTIQGEQSTFSKSVSAPRLDAVLAAAFASSREQAKDWIASDRVSINFMPCKKADQWVEQGDRLTVRGKGKVHVVSFDGTSKKGRLFITFQK